MDTRGTGELTGWRVILSFLAVLALLTGVFPGETGVAMAEDNHTHEGWTAWDTADSVPTATGSYYLTTDVTISSYTAGKCRIGRGNTVDLCLNGHSITFEFSEKGFDVYGGTLNLYDCGTEVHPYSVGEDGIGTVGSGEKTFTGGYVTFTHGRGGCTVHLDGGAFNMYGGTLIGNNGQRADMAGAVYVKSGTFNMYGGSIIGNKTGEFGGAGVCILGGKFNMYDGLIGDNTSAKWGGGIRAGAAVTISGGEIRDNHCDGSYGGGICVTKGPMAMSGGTVTGNTAKNGGGISAYDGTTTITGGTISNNTAQNSAGGVHNWATLVMSGGVITENESKGNSGGVWNAKESTFSMSGGIISNNKARQGGGVVNNETMNLSGGIITGNSAPEYGGGICNNPGKILNISGDPKVSGNTDGTNPSNVYLINGGLTVTGDLTGAKIGITMQNKPTAGNPAVFGKDYENHNSILPDTVFTSDSDSYAVSLKDKDAALIMKFSLTFDTNGGTGNPPAGGSYPEGTKIILPDAGDLKMAGHTLAGWSPEPAGRRRDAGNRGPADDNTGFYAPGDTFVIRGDTTLYAQWEAGSSDEKKESAPTTTAQPEEKKPVPQTGDSEDPLLLTFLLLVCVGIPAMTLLAKFSLRKRK